MMNLDAFDSEAFDSQLKSLCETSKRLNAENKELKEQEIILRKRHEVNKAQLKNYYEQKFIEKRQMEVDKYEADFKALTQDYLKINEQLKCKGDEKDDLDIKMIKTQREFDEKIIVNKRLMTEKNCVELSQLENELNNLNKQMDAKKHALMEMKRQYDEYEKKGNIVKEDNQKLADDNKYLIDQMKKLRGNFDDIQKKFDCIERLGEG
ncbi:unnamed protein product [Didymodactylos carnosus]|uniref:Uncharacterized protein n=1 Tax=Didymodactylos carnosus TaxID=1234261 RepID=A0A813TAC0_9BILA|nr:unnamed protein product [Didymodactylos carnosus]CAF0806918.1 unnamed protein product [Didymodactylos carnosus]CAF3504118.1 unnamed protein product [Didymodactylos carnosus]CAF3592385.1 unnamed protein product [Didymodactylos carnosus]